MGVNVDDEAEVAGQIAADFVPVVARVVAAHHVPVLLHEQGVRPCRVHGYVVDAVADFGGAIGDVVGVQPLVDRFPRLPPVVAAESAGGRDGDDDTVGVGRVEDDGVETQTARTGLPDAGCVMLAQAGQLLPRLSAVGRAEDSRVLDAGVDSIGVGRRRLQMPDALELPRICLLYTSPSPRD